MSNQRTCNRCQRVSFGVSRQYVEKEVAAFNDYFDSLSVKTREQYYGSRRSSVDDYARCMQCGNAWTNFRPSAPDDCPYGSTINPILFEEDP